jgi:hypothetical protein
VISRLFLPVEHRTNRCSWILKKTKKKKEKRKKAGKSFRKKKRRPVEHRTSGAAGKCTF